MNCFPPRSTNHETLSCPQRTTTVVQSTLSLTTHQSPKSLLLWFLLPRSRPGSLGKNNVEQVGVKTVNKACKGISAFEGSFFPPLQRKRDQKRASKRSENTGRKK